MIIKNHKNTYRIVADKLGLDVEMVELAAGFAWSELNRIVENFEQREIYVLKLGTFRFRKHQAERYINKMNAPYIEVFIRQKARDPEESLNRLAIKKGKVQRLLDEWNEIIDQKLKFKTKLNESINGDLPEPQTDLGRTEEQDI